MCERSLRGWFTFRIARLLVCLSMLDKDGEAQRNRIDWSRAESSQAAALAMLSAASSSGSSKSSNRHQDPFKRLTAAHAVHHSSSSSGRPLPTVNESDEEVEEHKSDLRFGRLDVENMPLADRDHLRKQHAYRCFPEDHEVERQWDFSHGAYFLQDYTDASGQLWSILHRVTSKCPERSGKRVTHANGGGKVGREEPSFIGSVVQIQPNKDGCMITANTGSHKIPWEDLTIQSHMITTVEVSNVKQIAAKAPYQPCEPVFRDPTETAETWISVHFPPELPAITKWREQFLNTQAQLERDTADGEFDDEEERAERKTKMKAAKTQLSRLQKKITEARQAWDAIDKRPYLRRIDRQNGAKMKGIPAEFGIKKSSRSNGGAASSSAAASASSVKKKKTSSTVGMQEWCYDSLDRALTFTCRLPMSIWTWMTDPKEAAAARIEDAEEAMKRQQESKKRKKEDEPAAAAAAGDAPVTKKAKTGGTAPVDSIEAFWDDRMKAEIESLVKPYCEKNAKRSKRKASEVLDDWRTARVVEYDTLRAGKTAEEAAQSRITESDTRLRATFNQLKAADRKEYVGMAMQREVTRQMLLATARGRRHLDKLQKDYIKRELKQEADAAAAAMKDD